MKRMLGSTAVKAKSDSRMLLSLDSGLSKHHWSAMTLCLTPSSCWPISLHVLGIVLDHTLPYSPYQNGKKETFWGNVEGRLMAMLEHVQDLTLEQLNRITQVWVEREYHHKRHRDIDSTPIKRFVQSPNVSRPCPRQCHVTPGVLSHGQPKDPPQ